MVNRTEVMWANRNIAVLARVHKIRRFQSEWTLLSEGQYAVRLGAAERVATTVVDAATLQAALEGTECAQAELVRTLTALVRSLKVE